MRSYVGLTPTGRYQTKTFVLPHRSQPRGIKWSPSGTWYICASNNAIYSLDNSGTVTRFAGKSGQEGSEDGDRLTEATFCFDWYMTDVLVDSATELLVADSGSHRIRLISGDTVSTFAGTTRGFLDGPKETCQFHRPTSLVRAHDKLFITDCLNHRIRVIDANGWVSSIGRSKTGGPFGSPQMSSKSPFWSPWSISVTPDMSSIIVTDRTAGYGYVFSISVSSKKILEKVSVSASPTQVVTLTDKILIGIGSSIQTIEDTTLTTLYEDEQIPLCFDVDRSSGDLLIGNPTHVLTMVRDFETPSKLIGSPREVDLSDSIQSSFNSETVEIVHRASGQSLHLASYLVTLYKFTPQALSGIENSTLPFENLKAFSESLSLSCPATHSVLESTWEGFDLVTATKTLGHVMRLYSMVGIELRRLNDRFEELCSQLQPAELADALVMIWTQCDRDNNLLRIAAGCMRPHWKLFMSRADDWTEIASQDMARFMMLVAHVCGGKMPSHSHVASESPMGAKLKELERTLEWRAKPFETGKSPDVFAFCIQGKPGYIDARGWVVHPQWKYFAKMITSGLSELKTHIITLPPYFPSAFLLVVLKYLHVRNFDPSSTYPLDAQLLYSHGTEFYFTNADHTPISPFEPIVRAVLGTVPTTDT